VFILKSFKFFGINTSTSADSKGVTGAVYLQEGNWEGGLILKELEGPRGGLPSRVKASWMDV
jgi:hypothetical protein